MHVAIVGAYGSAGVAAAGVLAEAEDTELTLIDGGDPGGGLCILRGCMPSKEVLSAGNHRFQVRHDDRLSGSPEIDLERVVERKDEHTSDFAAHRRAAVHDLAERDGVEFINEHARFTDERTIAVGDREITPDYVVLATGSEVAVPPVSGIEDVPYRTSTDVLDATDFGDSAVVLGMGYIGTEMTPYLAEAGGMDLTVIERGERPLAEADPEFGDRLLDIYREEFDIDIRTGTTGQEIEPIDGGGVRVRIESATEEEEGSSGDETEVVEADELFVFTGRQPTLDGLGIEHTALDPGEGWVEETLQARDDPDVFVVGDATGEELILHVAKEQGFHAAENVLASGRGESLASFETTHHHVIFSGLGTYPFVRVGHSAESAREAGIEVVEATREAADDGVFKTKDVPEGLARLVVGVDGTVLGYQGLHYQADATAKTAQVLIECELSVSEIPDRAYHPTTPELLDGLLREARDALD